MWTCTESSHKMKIHVLIITFYVSHRNFTVVSYNSVQCTQLTAMLGREKLCCYTYFKVFTIAVQEWLIIMQNDHGLDKLSFSWTLWIRLLYHHLKSAKRECSFKYTDGTCLNVSGQYSFFFFNYLGNEVSGRNIIKILRLGFKLHSV